MFIQPENKDRMERVVVKATVEICLRVCVTSPALVLFLFFY